MVDTTHLRLHPKPSFVGAFLCRPAAGAPRRRRLSRPKGSTAAGEAWAYYFQAVRPSEGKNLNPNISKC